MKSLSGSIGSQLDIIKYTVNDFFLNYGVGAMNAAQQATLQVSYAELQAMIAAGVPAPPVRAPKTAPALT